MKFYSCKFIRTFHIKTMTYCFLKNVWLFLPTFLMTTVFVLLLVIKCHPLQLLAYLRLFSRTWAHERDIRSTTKSYGYDGGRRGYEDEGKGIQVYNFSFGLSPYLLPTSPSVEVVRSSNSLLGLGKLHKSSVSQEIPHRLARMSQQKNALFIT